MKNKKEMSKEQIEERLMNKLENIINDFSNTMDDTVKYANKEDVESGVEIDIDSINLLETAFLLLCEKCDYPIEIIQLLFSHNEKYEKRLTNIILSKTLDSLEKKGLIKKLIDEETEETLYMSTEYYESAIK